MNNKRLQDIFIALLFGILPGLLLCAPAITAEPVEVTKKKTIGHPAHIVWRGIQSLRTCDPNSKLLSYQNNEALIYETFMSLPIIGDSSCTYKECETVQDRQIIYKMVNSDKFKVFEGSWTLEPKSPSETTVTLTSRIDSGIRIPFWREITKVATSRDLAHRLEMVEEQSKKIASESRTTN